MVATETSRTLYLLSSTIGGCSFGASVPEVTRSQTSREDHELRREAERGGWRPHGHPPNRGCVE